MTPDDPAHELLSALDPSADALLDLLRVRVDDAMLGEIADADYGMESAEHLRQLRRIRDTGRVPVPFDWYPKEVLELTKWWQPGTPSRHGRTEAEEHLRRAFACAALLRGAAEPGNANADFFEPDLIALALESAAALGLDAERAAERFLAARATLAVGQPEDRGWVGLGLVVVCLRTGPKPASWLERLGWQAIDWATAGEIGAGRAYYGLRYGVWQGLAARADLAGVSGVAGDVLAEAAGLIAGS